MDPSNRFSMLKLQEDELPSVSSFYNFLATSFPNIDEYLGMKPKKPFCHLEKNDYSKARKREERGLDMCQEESRKSKKVCTESSITIDLPSKLKSYENVTNEKKALDSKNQVSLGLVDNDIKNEYNYNHSSIINNNEANTSSSVPVPSTNFCAKIKSEPVDDSYVDMNMDNDLIMKHIIKMELKSEPGESEYYSAVEELMTMTADVISPYLDKKPPSSEIYSTFLVLCRRFNVVDLVDIQNPTVAQWKHNLYYFLKCILPNMLKDETSTENLTLTECYKCFMMLQGRWD